MHTAAVEERLELRSVVLPAIPLYLAIVAGGALAAGFGSPLPRLVGALVIGVALLMVDVGRLKRVLLTIVILEIPLQLDVFLGQDPTAFVQNNGFNVSLTTFALFALYTLWLAELAAGHRRIARIGVTVMPAAIYFAAIAGSLIVADGALLALYEINVVGQALLILIYVAHSVRTRQDVLLVVVLLVFGLAVQSCVAAAQQLFGLSFELGPIKGLVADGRATGTLRHANRLGSFAALLTGPALGLMMAGRVARSYRILGGASFLLGFLTLLLSQSRGALFGASVGIAAAVVVGYRRHWLTRRVLLIGGVVVAMIAFTQLGPINARLERGLVDTNVVGRVRLIELSIGVIRENFLLGVGANHITRALQDVLTTDFSGAWLATVHNKYVLVWAETGLLGLLAFSYFLFAILRRAWRTYLIDDPFLSPLALGFLAGGVAMMLHMNFDKFAARVDVHGFWLFAGVVFAMHQIADRRRLHIGGSEQSVGPVRRVGPQSDRAAPMP